MKYANSSAISAVTVAVYILYEQNTIYAVPIFSNAGHKL